MVKINWSKFKSERGTALFLVDLFMINLVLVNLLYILVEWNFTINFVNSFLLEWVPSFHAWYDTHLHQNFYWYDLFFLSIFILEFTIRWFLAVYHKHHHKWFFYPFIHWYDVLGCIPLAQFRFLRILRLGSMLFRLHKMGVINLREWYLFSIFNRYSAVIVEEISDRVVINVLEGVQDELKLGTPVASRIIVEVIRPQKDVLVEWLSSRITTASEQHYERYQEQLKIYVNRKVGEAVRNNPDVKDIAAIPLVGSTITTKLEKAVASITYSVIEGIMLDLSSPENTKIISELADVTMDMLLLQEEDEELNKMSVEMINQSIEILKDQVKVKRWQEAG
ncbi:MAG: hypothetical protein K9G46_13055 [Flavobacteriales bacterium]|jgi:hypothetical protein|nr:hypothetical protein [Flavobacteriales bacterium]